MPNNYGWIGIVWLAISVVGGIMVGNAAKKRQTDVPQRSVTASVVIHWVISVVVFSLTAYLMGAGWSMTTVGIVLTLSTGLTFATGLAVEHFSTVATTD